MHVSQIDRIRGAVGIGMWVVANPLRVTDVVSWIRHRKESPWERREPWWPHDAVHFVRDRLPVGADVFEFGGGGSTAWLTDLGANVICVEHEPEWAQKIATGAPGADVRLVEPSTVGQFESANGGFFDEYLSSIHEIGDKSLDLVVVDGRCRVPCALAAIPKIRDGGLLLLDDSDRDRYRVLHEQLADWPVQHLRGLKPSGVSICQTSVWTKPR